jgi:recombination protein RecT
MSGSMEIEAAAEQAKVKTPAQVFKHMLDLKDGDIAGALPKNIGVDSARFRATALAAITLNPELLTCTFPSLFASIMQAAKDGLLPDNKEAFIAPYNCNIAQNGAPARFEKRAQYMPMVKGIIQIMYRAGAVMVDGVAVRQRDKFAFERGDAPSIMHKPYFGKLHPGPVVAAYAIIKMANGEIKREVMSAYDLDEVKSVAKSKKAWDKWEDQFSIKAVLKRASKQMASDSVLQSVIEHDNSVNFDFDQREEVPAIKREQQPRIQGQSSRLDSIIGQSTKIEEPVLRDTSNEQ